MTKLRYSALMVLIACLIGAAWAFSVSQSDQTFARQDGPPIPQRVKVLIVGNSITFHQSSSPKHWPFDQGMAASSPDRDYAHSLLKQLSVPPSQSYIRNFYPFETSHGGAKANMAALSAVTRKRPSLTVIQLGDNVKFYNPVQLWYFRDDLAELLKSVRDSGRVLCLSTFWHSRIVDAVIEEQCEGAQGRYVFIGDLYEKQLHAARQERQYSDPGVNRHPKDEAMHAIARRLYEAARS